MTRRTIIFITAALAAIALTLAAQAMSRGHHGGVTRPAKEEFGPGPRTTDKGLYIVTLQGAGDLEARKLYTIQATIADGATGLPVTDATIAIDGGMPQHGHGLPTRPRMTRVLGNGWYEIGGLRFNMGGWWELKLTVTTPAGTDTVTFNLSI